MRDREERKEKKCGLLKKLLVARAAWTAVGVPVAVYRNKNRDAGGPYDGLQFALELVIAVAPEAAVAYALLVGFGGLK